MVKVMYADIHTGGVVSLDVSLDELNETASYFARKVMWVKDFASRLLGKVGLGSPSEPLSEVRVDTMRRKLLRDRVRKAPLSVTAAGMFMPTLLLAPGWWERKSVSRRKAPSWQDPIQQWLFRGFEEWGPSWDINAETSVLLGQIGELDEANSLAVIIQKDKAKQVRDNLLGDQLVVAATISGLLCHRKHLDPATERLLSRWGKAFDYCILVRDEKEGDTVSQVLNRSREPYSGYLWMCLMPEAWLQPGKSPRLQDAFFIWEHTEFTSSDAITYNLDSLQHKAAYLEARHGKLALLQKSLPMIPGEPSLRSRDFLNMVLERK